MINGTTVTGLGERFEQLNRLIAGTIQQQGRSPGDVKLLAVSKRRSSDEIRECAGLGQLAFGENYLQEALPKIGDCRDLNLEWHFIGRLQRNKTADVAKNFDWVHTVDRVSVAKRLNDQRPEGMAPLAVCVQVNIDGAENKAGIPPDQLTGLLLEISGLKRLQLRGLMTMPEPSEGVESQRRPFRQLADLLASAVIDFPEMDVLSMGMSGDLEAAIAEGSTLLRIGTALFGARAEV